MKMKGNTMTKKTIVFLVGGVVLAFAAVAVYAAIDTSQTLTNDTSITNAEVANTEGCGQVCGKDCESCKDCNGDCEDCDMPCKDQGGRYCDMPCKDQGGRCGSHGCGI